MGSKNNPGAFDCYAKAADDEPMFILLARDTSAALLTHIWAAIRQGKSELARLHFESLLATTDRRYEPVVPPVDLEQDVEPSAEHVRQQAAYEAWLKEQAQADEATQCADAMIAWHMQNRQGG